MLFSSLERKEEREGEREGERGRKRRNDERAGRQRKVGAREEHWQRRIRSCKALHQPGESNTSRDPDGTRFIEKPWTTVCEYGNKDSCINTCSLYVHSSSSYAIILLARNR